MWHGLNAGSNQTAFEQLVADYNASQTKVNVNAIVQGGYEDVIAKYLQSSKGDLPDMVQMPEYMTQTMIDTKESIPIEACIRASKLRHLAVPARRAAGVQRGRRAVGHAVQRQRPGAVLQQEGLPGRPGSTRTRRRRRSQDVRDMSQKIVDSGAAKYGLAVDSGFDSGGGWYIEQWFAQLGQFYADNENGRAARATKVLYDNDTGVDLLTQMQQLIKDGLAVDVGDNAGGFDNLLKLADEKEPAAMSIATSASLGPAINILNGGQFPQLTAEDIGVGPMPGPNGAKGAIVGGASMWITDRGNDAKEAAAWDFLQYLTGAQQQSTFSSATGYIAARNDARDLDPLKTTLATDPRFAVALDQLNLIADAPTSAGPIIGPLKEVRTVTAQAVAQIFAGVGRQVVARCLGPAVQRADRRLQLAQRVAAPEGGWLAARLASLAGMATPFPALDGSAPRQQKFSEPPEMGIDPSKRYTATMETSLGTIVIALDAINAPLTVNNFVFLAAHHYYDGVIFHRIINGFMCQGGDPQGTGTGGPGYKFKDEPVKQRYQLGSVAMANAGPNTNGSQFFLISGPSGVNLPPQYNHFGQIVKGLDVLDAMQRVSTGRGDRPHEDVVINSVTISVAD